MTLAPSRLKFFTSHPSRQYNLWRHIPANSTFYDVKYQQITTYMTSYPIRR